jgi:hypothetical protein
MYSYQSFTPGSRSNTSRIINYVAQAQANGKDISTCYCIPDKYDKNTPGSDAASARVSYATKIAQIIQSKRGGTAQYGNFYLGQPLNINYLGRIEGMPGGGGKAPTNRF